MTVVRREGEGGSWSYQSEGICGCWRGGGARTGSGDGAREKTGRGNGARERTGHGDNVRMRAVSGDVAAFSL